MYVARDKDGDLYLFLTRPVKDDGLNTWLSEDYFRNWIKLDPSRFPEVKWEDEEPTEVELVKKEKITMKNRKKVSNSNPLSCLSPYSWIYYR